MTRRDAILSGIARATELHARLGIREALAAGDRPVDVIRAVQQMGLFLMYRPLDGLLGAYVPTRALSGMLITTKRDLHVQRFTAAHELGHHMLEHRTLSLDKVVGFVGRGEASSFDLQEIEADSFAAEFLLPKWLIVAHLRRQGWRRPDINQPDVVYQLSLRLGVSYAAMCWGFLSQDFLEKKDVERLLKTEPRTAKQRALPDVKPDNWHRDVWVVSEKDQGARILGGPEDLIVVALEEHVAGGYIWDTQGVQRAGMHIEKDDRETAHPNRMGGAVRRRLVLQGQGTAHLHLEERRVWDQKQPSRSTFDLDLVLLGREPEGIPRAGRLLAA